MALAKEFSPQAVQQDFLNSFENGTFEDVLRAHFADFVPFVYSTKMDVDPAREERKAKRILFTPMEEFFCDGEPREVFKQLKSLDDPPALCGKVFKLGEPTYSCRDCGMDPTCVLCIDCFQHSAHKKHRYRMSTSGGGGYCDCGDLEAWKSEPFCITHKRGMSEGNQMDPMDKLPDTVKKRATVLFRCVIKYTVLMLTWEGTDKLPEGLEPDPKPQTFLTMLFNDEVHTYDQVITTLQRAVECTHQEAVEFATTVDREGRSTVKDGNFNDCDQAKRIIEKQTSRLNNKPLRTHVMHTSVVSHQTFAQKILVWLQQIITKSAGLRQLFCHLSLKRQTGEELSTVETMMLADTKLWKAARIQTHQLFMAGVLMDAECKKLFSILFTKHYPQLLHDFIQDDHYRPVSATSCSVQIFTVPTLARMLITEHNLLEVILSTFLKECSSKRNKDGKFAWERQERNSAYKRAYFMLYDLKYALSSKPTPDEWNLQLRESFLRGFSKMLELLKCMQGMDSVKRQTGHHIEFEPEWESAFNLQIKLADNLAIMLDWCGSDREVLMEAYQRTIACLYSMRNDQGRHLIMCKVAGANAQCIRYDVSREHVSIHQPVTRLLAGLYTQLHKFHITPQMALHTIDHKHQPSAIDLLEPSLRAIVLVAQTQAGMWRRNGYSLLNQIYFYHNVKCRSEMHDRDIQMAQACATHMDSCDFIINLINKFGLTNWVKEEYDNPKDSSHEDMLRQIITLAEEFLNLLLVILSERCVEGIGVVGPNDPVKREVIHQLCIQPMAHSELTKALPEDPCHETGIENVVSEVAEFRKPTTATGKGMYALKKEWYKEFNPFFFHYLRSDQSKAEEAQRKRKKLENEDQALPPPVPVPFVDGFSPVMNLLQCDTMIYIMRLILHRVGAKRSKSLSEIQFEKVLHLIGLALHEERWSHHQGKTDFHFCDKTMRLEPTLLSMLEGLVGHDNITHDAQKDLLVWVVKAFKEVLALKNSSFAMEVSAAEEAESSQVTAEKVEREKKRKAEMVARKREKVMQKMLQMQRNFIKDNPELFESTSSELKSASSDMDISQPDEEAAVERCPISIGPKRSPATVTSTIRAMCILCQEEQDVLHNDRAMVLSAFVQRSTVLSQSRGKMVENVDEYDPLFVSSDLIIGAHTSTCGHVMHADCWQSFFDALLAKERRRTLRHHLRHHLSYDIEKMEFLCPLCETLSNTVIPIIPHLSTLLKDNEKQEVELSLDDWLDGIQKTVKNSIKEHKDKESAEESFLFVPCPLSSITKMMAESVAKNFQLLFDYVYDDASAHFSDSITVMLKKFATDVYSTGLGVHPDDENTRVPIMAWTTCAYTISSVETCLRDENKPLFGALPSRQEDCLSALIRFSAVCSQIFQPDVIKKHCVTLLSALVCDSADNRLQETPLLVDMDLFHHLVALCFSLPTLYAEEDVSSTKLTRIPTGGLNDLHALQLSFTAHLVHIMLTADFQHEESMDAEVAPELAALHQIYKELTKLAGVTPEHEPSPWQLSRHLQTACLPFLRCAAMFFYYLTGVAPPPELKELGHETREQFRLLCHYLALPEDFSTYFHKGDVIKKMIKSWCQDETMRKRLSASKELVVKYPLVPNHLQPLPGDYSELINKVSTFTCPKSDGDDSRVPTMCLVCGKILCSQSYCCQTVLEGNTVGAATAHAHSCGAGTGIFLRVRECQVLLLSGRTKGCCFAPPYLDDYGETDQGLRRGNPLHLCKDRYQELQRLWLNHGLPEKIAHLFETNTNLLSIEWQHL